MELSTLESNFRTALSGLKNARDNRELLRTDFRAWTEQLRDACTQLIEADDALDAYDGGER